MKTASLKFPKIHRTDSASRRVFEAINARLWPFPGRIEEGRRFFMNLWKKTNCGLGNFKPPEIIQFHSAADKSAQNSQEVATFKSSNSLLGGINQGSPPHISNIQKQTEQRTWGIIKLQASC